MNSEILKKVPHLKRVNTTMRKILSVLILAVLVTTNFFAQGTAGTNAKFEYRSLIDMPSAGILEKGFVGVTLDVLPYGNLISKIEVGVFDNISFGISFGGSNIIGSGKVDWYRYPGVNFRLRLLDETQTIPAITMGFDSQGKGAYLNDKSRYEIKSPGFYAAAAKNFEFLGYLSIHGILNYTLERKDGDKDINLGIGVEKTIGSQLSLVAEYDLGTNDDSETSIGDGKGYLNIGARWSPGAGFTIGFDLRDLINNKKFTTTAADRAIFVEYVKAIF